MNARRPGGPIRTGLVGYGTAGKVFHAPFLAADPDYSLDVVVTGDPDRGVAVTADHPGTTVVPTTDELLAAADGLDLVVIGSPPSSHAALAHAALDAGLAVVVDKPFVVTAAEGREVVQHAEQAGLPLTVFQNPRWDGDFLTLRSLVADGALGTVHRFESRFEWWKPQVPASWKSETPASAGGGILFDLGTHLVDQALQLFGEVTDVHAELATWRPGAVADDDAFVSLLHASGVRSHLWMNSLTAQTGPRFHVLGAEAAYTTWGLDPQEATLKAGVPPTDPDHGRTPEEAWGVLGVDGALTRHPTARGDYAAFYRAMADCLLRGGPVPVDPRDSLRVIQILETIHTQH